jgi:hypothetical protein
MSNSEYTKMLTENSPNRQQTRFQLRTGVCKQVHDGLRCKEKQADSEIWRRRTATLEDLGT